MEQPKQPWLANPLQECIFIIAPAFVPVILVFAFRDYFISSEVSPIWWVVLVLCVDVSHVYSTLFRLYWDRPTFQKYKTLLIIIPATTFLVGLALHYQSPLLFWRLLAYIAVYHFIRQQYGFMRLYSRKEKSTKTFRAIDNLTIHAATVYPLLWWHIHATDKLSWFVNGDFVHLDFAWAENYFTGMYLAIILIYFGKELSLTYRLKSFNVPKNLVVTGTAVSWYVGIVAFQGDLIFTMLNVVAHGVPYMALIWLHGKKHGVGKFNFRLSGIFIFIALLFMLAYVEETFWDGLLWKEHQSIFPLLSESSALETPLITSLVVAILILPQATHYVLDGFIWRFSKDSMAQVD
jgi:hypothetical protein